MSVIFSATVAIVRAGPDATANISLPRKFVAKILAVLIRFPITRRCAIFAQPCRSYVVVHSGHASAKALWSKLRRQSARRLQNHNQTKLLHQRRASSES